MCRWVYMDKLKIDDDLHIGYGWNQKLLSFAKTVEENGMVFLFNVRKICMIKVPDCNAEWSKESLLPSFTIGQRVH